MRFFIATALVGVSAAQNGDNGESSTSVNARLNLVNVCPQVSAQCGVPTGPVAQPDALTASLQCMLKVDLSSVPPGPCFDALEAFLIGHLSASDAVSLLQQMQSVQQAPYIQVPPTMMQPFLRSAMSAQLPQGVSVWGRNANMPNVAFVDIQPAMGFQPLQPPFTSQPQQDDSFGDDSFGELDPLDPRQQDDDDQSKDDSKFRVQGRSFTQARDQRFQGGEERRPSREGDEGGEEEERRPSRGGDERGPSRGDDRRSRGRSRGGDDQSQSPRGGDDDEPRGRSGDKPRRREDGSEETESRGPRGPPRGPPRDPRKNDDADETQHRGPPRGSLQGPSREDDDEPQRRGSPRGPSRSSPREEDANEPQPRGPPHGPREYDADEPQLRGPPRGSRGELGPRRPPRGEDDADELQPRGRAHGLSRDTERGPRGSSGKNDDEPRPRGPLGGSDDRHRRGSDEDAPRGRSHRSGGEEDADEPQPRGPYDVDEDWTAREEPFWRQSDSHSQDRFRSDQPTRWGRDQSPTRDAMPSWKFNGEQSSDKDDRQHTWSWAESDASVDERQPWRERESSWNDNQQPFWGENGNDFRGRGMNGDEESGNWPSKSHMDNSRYGERSQKPSEQGDDSDRKPDISLFWSEHHSQKTSWDNKRSGSDNDFRPPSNQKFLFGGKDDGRSAQKGLPFPDTSKGFSNGRKSDRSEKIFQGFPAKFSDETDDSRTFSFKFNRDSNEGDVLPLETMFQSGDEPSSRHSNPRQGPFILNQQPPPTRPSERNPFSAPQQHNPPTAVVAVPPTLALVVQSSDYDYDYNDSQEDASSAPPSQPVEIAPASSNGNN